MACHCAWGERPIFERCRRVGRGIKIDKTPEEKNFSLTRLNKYIASCGSISRRRADELIASGRVRVDGVVATPGTMVGPSSVVELNGEPLVPTRKVCLVMNKPRGVVSAVIDQRERTIVDTLPEEFRELGVFPVGRLDKDSEGLILLTNDGDLAQRISHPSNGVRRTYRVRLTRPIEDDGIEAWRRGAQIDGGFARPLSVERKGPDKLIVVLGEGFKREIRLLARALGFRVERLKRIGIGRLFLEKLPPGGFCEYNCEEVLKMILYGGKA